MKQRPGMGVMRRRLGARPEAGERRGGVRTAMQMAESVKTEEEGLISHNYTALYRLL